MTIALLPTGYRFDPVERAGPADRPFFFSRYGSEYQIRILNLVGIFISLAVSYNLVNGVTGQFSLAPNAFIALGAYTAALLTMTPEEKKISFIIEPLIGPLNQICLPFPLALLAGGLVAAFFGFLIGFPVFRVKGDYLAIVTLGFGEVVRVAANNLQSVTNGPLGLKGLPPYTNLWWSWGVALLTVFFVARLVRGSYGRALKAVRQDELAAAAMGINVFWHKMLAFIISAFFGGLGGGLLAHLITTISPTLFSFFLTFNLLIMIVVGGLGSITGSVIAAALITWGGEWLRWVEEPMHPRTLAGAGNSRHAHGSFLHYSAGGHSLRPGGPYGPEGIFLEQGVAPKVMTLLEISHLTLFFEGLMAVNDFSWQVGPGMIMGLIGPNGAGKTTVFNLITGVLKPRDGRVRFNGREITGWPPHAVCREGIGRTFQNIRLLPEMTVLENVLMAFHGRLRSSFWGAVFQVPRYRREERIHAAPGAGYPGTDGTGGKGGGPGPFPDLRPAAEAGDRPGPGYPAATVAAG